MSSSLRKATCTAFFIVLSLILSSVAAPGALHAQARPVTDSIDVAVTFAAQRTLRANTGQNFWLEGGSAELGIPLARGFGIAADFTGTQSSSIGSSGVPLVLETATFGPRYRLHAGRRWSPYVQALFGEATGSHSTFATPNGAVSSATSFAFQANGGVDYQYSKHIGIRVIDAGYLHTGLSNGSSNAQDTLRLGAGIVFRFRP